MAPKMQADLAAIDEARSFPKLPLGTSAMKWLDMKREVDQKKWGVEANLWCIHGKQYDLSKFMDRHPGGPQWLEFCQGMDCTEAYEVHHIDRERTDQMLKKYYVKDTPINPPPRFTFKDDGLFRTLQRRCQKVLAEAAKSEGGKSNARGPTRWMQAVTWAALLIYVGAFALLLARPGWIPALLLGAATTWMIGLGHNYFHQADTPWRFLFGASAFLTSDWRVTHALSHHLFPNLDMDYEISAFEGYGIHFLTKQPTNSLLGVVTMLVLSFLSSAITYPISLAENLPRIVRNPFDPDYCLPALQLSLLYYAYGNFADTIFWWVVVQAVGSAWILHATFPLHRSESCWTAGDPKPELDFALHTIKTTEHHAKEGSLISNLFFHGLFPDHILHHLFPTLDASRHALLHQTFEETCKEFGVGVVVDRVHFPTVYRTTLKRIGGPALGFGKPRAAAKKAE